MRRDGRCPNRPMQLGLLGAATPSVDRRFTNAHRIALDATSWVETVPGWLSRPEVLFDALTTQAGWEQRQRWMFTQYVIEPRLTAEYPVLAEAPIPLLHTIADALSSHYEVPYDGLWVNLYRDHRDSTSWHFDSNCRSETCIVPVLSLGATRRFALRPKAGGPSTTLTAMAGDLIVMGGRCQRDWVHAVPKQAHPAGPRISVNFKSEAQGVPREDARPKAPDPR